MFVITLIQQHLINLIPVPVLLGQSEKVCLREDTSCIYVWDFFFFAF